MIRRTATAIAMVATLFFTTAVPASAASVADVDGLWGGIDIDGSRQVMLIAGSDPASLGLLLLDSDATICGGGPVLAFGSGSLSGDRVDATYGLLCFNGTRVAPVSIGYEYDAGTNTLTDDVGALWNNLFG